MKFGEFFLDRATQRLWRNGESVPLHPRAWSILCCLADRPGELVTKSELLATAWPDVAVSDAALSQALQRLRRALADDARCPRFIETVHRRGFRFIAAAPADAAEAVPSPSIPARGPSAAPGLFVGRATERRQLAEQMAFARAGTRQVALIEGEVGIGKTALLDVFLAELTPDAGRGLLVATASCVEQQANPEPYLPIFDALDRLVRSDGRLVDLLRQHAPTWLAQLPWLIGPDEARRLRDSLTDGTHRRMLREMARTLEVATSEATLVLAIEDLHWADSATLDLLGSLARRTEPARLMVLATYRPAQAIVLGHPIIELARALAARRACTRLSLEALTPVEVSEYLSTRFVAPELAAALAPPVHARSEGNPLFLETIVDHLVERGLVANGAGGWRLTKSVGIEDLKDVPQNLRDMIELQLDSIGAGELEVLEAASAASLSFRAASVAAALGQCDANGLERVEDTCERLARHWRVLRHAGEQTWPDGTRTACYAFRHELYRQVLYERMAATRRRRLHQRIGERLEQAYASDCSRIAAELARHFDQSGDDARAVTYLLVAARQARRRFAEREAGSMLRAALRRLEYVPPGSERDLQELQVLLGLMLARVVTDESWSADQDRHFARIEELVAVVPESRQLFRLLCTLSRIYAIRSLPRRAARTADRLTELAAHGDPGSRMEACLASSTAAVMLGRFTAAAEHSARACETYGDGNPPTCASFPDYEHKWPEAGLRIHGQLGAALFFVGALDRALTHLRRSIALCAGPIRPHSATVQLLSAAGFLAQRGDLALARSTAMRGFEIAEEHQLSNLIAVSGPQRTWLAITAGDRASARSRIAAAWQHYLRADGLGPAPIGPLFLVDACRLIGAVDDGLAIAERVWTGTRATGLYWYDAELQRLRGELLLLRNAAGTRVKARACFADALEIARRQGARLYELRAATSLFRLGPRGRGHAGARAVLERAYGALSEGFDTPDLQAAARLLGVPRTLASPAGSAACDASLKLP